MKDKLLKYSTWLIPIIIVWISYANTFFSSQFSGVEIFSWQVMFIDAIKMLILWTIAYWAIKKVAQNGQKPGLGLYILLVLSLPFVHFMIYAVHKQYMIITIPLNDSIKLLHFIVNILEGLLLSFICVSFLYFLHYQERWGKAQVKTANLEKENSKAQLHALQTQVNPHFLFNNLNTLQGLIHEDNYQAQDFLIELSQLYRYLLNKADSEVVSLHDEIEVAQKFNFLIEQRYGAHYQCDIKIASEDLHRKYLPPFTLQILLENVVKHNRIDDDHQVKCVIETKGDWVEVRNNRHPKTSSYASNKIGLENLRQRYAILSNQEIKVEEKKGAFIVTVPLLTIETYA